MHKRWKSENHSLKSLMTFLTILCCTNKRDIYINKIILTNFLACNSWLLSKTLRTWLYYESNQAFQNQVLCALIGGLWKWIQSFASLRNLLLCNQCCKAMHWKCNPMLGNNQMVQPPIFPRIPGEKWVETKQWVENTTTNRYWWLTFQYQYPGTLVCSLYAINYLNATFDQRHNGTASESIQNVFLGYKCAHCPVTGAKG